MPKQVRYIIFIDVERLFQIIQLYRMTVIFIAIFNDRFEGICICLTILVKLQRLQNPTEQQQQVSTNFSLLKKIRRPVFAETR